LALREAWSHADTNLEEALVNKAKREQLLAEAAARITDPLREPVSARRKVDGVPYGWFRVGDQRGPAQWKLAPLALAQCEQPTFALTLRTTRSGGTRRAECYTLGSFSFIRAIHEDGSWTASLRRAGHSFVSAFEALAGRGIEAGECPLCLDANAGGSAAEPFTMELDWPDADDSGDFVDDAVLDLLDHVWSACDAHIGTELNFGTTPVVLHDGHWNTIKGHLAWAEDDGFDDPFTMVDLNTTVDGIRFGWVLTGEGWSDLEWELVPVEIADGWLFQLYGELTTLLGGAWVECWAISGKDHSCSTALIRYDMSDDVPTTVQVEEHVSPTRLLVDAFNYVTNGWASERCPACNQREFGDEPPEAISPAWTIGLVTSGSVPDSLIAAFLDEICTPCTKHRSTPYECDGRSWTWNEGHWSNASEGALAP